MPTTQQKFALTDRHQLVDLNKEYENFQLTFQVQANNPQESFEALVIEQKQLDANPDLSQLEMKKATGKIGGTIATDKGKYQNFFLVLRGLDTTKPTEVDVTTQIEEISPNSLSAPSPPIPSPTIDQTTPPSTLTPVPSPVTAKPFYTQTWFVILIIGATLGFMVYYYLFVIRKKTVVGNVGVTTPTTLQPQPTLTDGPAPVVSIPEGPTPTTTVSIPLSSTSPAISDGLRSTPSSKDALYSRLKAVTQSPPSS